MKATDLRIGNLVKTGQAILEIRAIGLDGCDLRGVNIVAAFSSDLDGVEPIPLTEEWLERAGFECIDRTKEFTNVFGEIKIFFKQLEGNHGGAINEKLEFSLNNYDEYFSCGKTFTPIQYVHQLQNLYFALTGTELTVSETANLN